MWRVEVKAGKSSKDGLTYDKQSLHRDRFDLLAIVVNGQRIVYKPELPGALLDA